jgi:hypothetical protein
LSPLPGEPAPTGGGRGVRWPAINVHRAAINTKNSSKINVYHRTLLFAYQVVTLLFNLNGHPLTRHCRRENLPMRTTLPMLAIAASLLASPLLAQETSTWINRNPSGSFAYTPPEAPHRHSSTYQEGVQRGQAALERALADRELQSAQAAILLEQAYSMSLDNYLKKTQTYIVRNELLDEFRHRERVNRISRRDQLRQLKQVGELREALDDSLSEFDVNFHTGTVYWPTLVAGPRYAEYRRQLDTLMAALLTGTGDLEAHREKLVSLCNEFRHQLYQDRLNDPHAKEESLKAEYAATDRLLKRLRYTPIVLSSPTDMLSMQ